MNTTYNYINCNKTDFAKEISFSEIEFTKILTECFETHAEIEKINVSFHLEPANSTGIFSCSISLLGKYKDFYIEGHSDKQFSSLVTKLCHKAVFLARQQADKKLNYRQNLD